MSQIWMDVDTAVASAPVNILPLLDDTDFKSIESSVAYNASGLALKWNFTTTAGVTTQTAVTPTTSGVYDWTNLGAGMYAIEIPASGGGSINNDTEGFGWFSGVATGVLPWRGPIIGFRAAGLNDKMIDSAYDTTRGLAGTALPNAAAEASGGLYTRGTGAGQITQSTNGQIDVDAKKINGVATSSVTAVNANVGTSQPVNFTGTAGSALVKSDTVDIAGAAVSTSSAQVGVNVVSYASGQVPLQPTTAGRTLDVTATGEAGIDWANIGGPTTTVNLSGTTVKTATDVETDTQDIQTRLPAALVSGRIDASVGAMAANTLTNTALATSAVDEIADGVWDEALSGHTTAGTAGKALSDAGSAGDPWSTAIPGSYTGSQAGKVVGDALDAAVSSRAVAGDAMTLTSGERNSIAAALLDLSNAIETGVTLRQSQRLMLAALAGKLSGAAGTTVTFRNAVADSKNRIVATVDANGNRTAITTDMT